MTPRPNPVRARLRSLLLLAIGGASVIVATVLSAPGSAANAYGARLGDSVRVLAIAAAVTLNVVLFTVAFRVLTARPVTIREIRAAAVTWQALQWAGTLLLGQKLKGATATYGLFGIVLGLLAWIYAGALTTVTCAEFNAVRAGGLWPRGLLTPFAGDAELTPADKRAYTSYARTERHKTFENIDVSFGEPPRPAPEKPQP